MDDMPETAPRDLAPALTPERTNVARGAAAESDQSRAMAEVQAQMILAKKFPRNEIQARDRILNSCARKGLAEISQYSFARGGATITGPSINLLTVAAANWGNILHGWRELSRVKGSSEVEAFAWDVESNTRISRTITVKHIRDTKGGGKAITDERDINELCANWASRGVRTCLEKIIPPDILDDAVTACNQTLSKGASTSPDDIRRTINAFKDEYEVTQEMLEARIQRRMESITPMQVVALGRIFQSLKDGMSKPEDWFDMTLASKDMAKPNAAKPATAGEDATPAKEKEKKTPKPKEEKAAETKPPAAAAQAEQQPQTDKPSAAAAKFQQAAQLMQEEEQQQERKPRRQVDFD